MTQYQPLLNDLLATRDGLSHRLLFTCSTPGYDVPCEIYIPADRQQVIIAASTTRRLPKKLKAAAAQITASSCQHDVPFLFVDEPSRRLVAILPVKADAVFEPLFDLLLRSTLQRLMTVARRIDLHVGGLDITIASRIDQSAVLQQGLALRRYRPFKKTKTDRK